MNETLYYIVVDNNYIPIQVNMDDKNFSETSLNNAYLFRSKYDAENCAKLFLERAESGNFDINNITLPFKIVGVESILQMVLV